MAVGASTSRLAGKIPQGAAENAQPIVVVIQPSPAEAAPATESSQTSAPSPSSNNDFFGGAVNALANVVAPPEKNSSASTTQTSSSAKNSQSDAGASAAQAIAQIRDKLLEWQKASGDNRTGTPVLSVIDKGGSLADVNAALHKLRETTTHPSNTKYLDPIIIDADAALKQSKVAPDVVQGIPSKEEVQAFVDRLQTTLNEQGLTVNLSDALATGGTRLTPNVTPIQPLPSPTTGAPVGTGTGTSGAQSSTPNPTPQTVIIQPQQQQQPQSILPKLSLTPLEFQPFSAAPNLIDSSILQAQLQALSKSNFPTQATALSSSLAMPPPMQPLTLATKSFDDLKASQAAGLNSVIKSNTSIKPLNTNSQLDTKKTAELFASIFGS